MDCKRDEEALSAYLDGELELAARQELESHLETCDACRNQLAAQRRLGEMFAALPEVTPSGDFEARFWARVARGADPEQTLSGRLRAYFSPRRLTAFAAAAAAAIAFAIAVPQQSQKTPAPAETAERAVADPDVKIVRSAEDFQMLQDPDMDAIADVDAIEVWESDGSGSPG